jgi:hypothetical protein
MNHCVVLRENSERLFWILWNPARTMTRRRIIEANLQCSTGVNDQRAKLQRSGTIFNKQTQIAEKRSEQSRVNIWLRPKTIGRFETLGSLVTTNNDESLKIQRRFQTANRCYVRLRKKLQFRSGEGVWQPVYNRWSHAQKTRRPATEGYFYNKTTRNGVARKTEIQVGGWGDQR